MKKILLLLMILPCSAFAQRMSVTIVGRHDSEKEVTKHIPGSASTRSSTISNCKDKDKSTNCSKTTTHEVTFEEERDITWNVRGTVLELLLPDQRTTVVACSSKFSFTQNVRSCRIPEVDEIEAEFSGKKAKLIWSVSLDGKKKESETYDMIAVRPAAPAKSSGE